MCSNFIENVQGYLSQCRDLENAHHERMLEIAIITLEKVVKNELDDEISEDLRMVRDHKPFFKPSYDEFLQWSQWYLDQSVSFW